MKKLLYILFFLISFTSFTQKSKIDSLYQIINNNKEDFNYDAFLKFHQLYITINKNIKDRSIKKEYDGLYDMAFSYAKEVGNKDLIYQVKYQTFQYYYLKKDDKKFIKIAQELYNDPYFLQKKESVSLLNLLIYYYSEVEEYSEMIALYPLFYKQIERHQELAFRITDGNKNNDLGNLYYRLKDYKKSRFYFKKSERGFFKEKNLFNQSSALNNIGLTFYKENKLDSARYYYNKSLKIITKIEPKTPEIKAFIPVIKSNIAAIWVKQKQYNKALPYYLNELKINNYHGKDYLSIRAAYLKIAGLYYLKKEFENSNKYLDSTNFILKKYPSNKLYLEYLKIKAKNFLAQGKIESAEIIFQKIKKRKDSLDAAKLKRKDFLASVKFDIQQREKKWLITKERLNVQKKGIAILFILLIGLLFLLYRIIKNQQKLNYKTTLVQKSLEEKEILLKEVHHRVKNNLQIIASILDLQNAKLDNKELNDILEQGQNRIQSMALIHQQLYQSKNLSDVAIEKYLKALINHIAILNNNANVKFNIKANNLKFNINTAIPLGLIINELITNIYKHAFKNNDKGEVFIEIKQKKEHLYELTFKDTGKGFPEGFDFNTTDSLGLKLIKILTQQLKGTVTIKKNATFIIEFRDDATI